MEEAMAEPQGFGGLELQLFQKIGPEIRIKLQ